MEQKLELITKGYVFTLANILFTLNGLPVIGIIFGVIAAVFFIRSLRIKEE